MVEGFEYLHDSQSSVVKTVSPCRVSLWVLKALDIVELS